MKYSITDSGGKIEYVVRESAISAEKRKLLVYKDQITCKPGCSHCCARPITITLAEALVIKDYLKKTHRLKEVMDRLKGLQDFEFLDAGTWYAMGIKCPVLDLKTNKCLAYEVRPIACSTHFSKADPSSCDPKSFKPLNLGIFSMDDIADTAFKSLKNAVKLEVLKYETFVHRALGIISRIDQMEGLTLEEILIKIGKDI